MAFPFDDIGLFLPTTDVFDTQIIYELDINSTEFKEFLVRLRQSVNDIALAVNLKDSAMYFEQEFVNGQILFPNPALDSTTSAAPDPRQVFRFVMNFGALPNTGTKSVAHNLAPDANWSVTRLYAAATDPVALSYIPIPYASPVLANNIELNVDATNVNITTGSNRSNYTICYVIWEYIKS